MAGPWEQYQSAPAATAPPSSAPAASPAPAPADGPWAQYGSQASGEHGYAYAPPEEKPPTPSASDPAGGTVSADGSYVPAAAVPAPGAPSSTPAYRSALGLPDQLTPEQRQQINAPTPLERVWQGVKEGWQDAPTLLPPESGQQVTPGSGLGLNQPLVTIGNTILGAGNALLRGGQAFAYENIAPYSVPLARDVAALPEALPTGPEMPIEPGSYAAARAGSTRAPLQIRASSPPPVSLNELSAAINRVPPEAIVPPQNQMMQGEVPPPSGPAPEASSGVSGDFQITDPTTGKSLGGGSFGGTSPQPSAPQAPPEPAAQPPPQPDAAAPPAQPTHIYQGPEYDQPVTPTGNEQTHTDGRTYAEVQPPDGPVTWVPKENVVAAPEPAPAAGAQVTPPDQAGLTPEQAAAAGSTADKQWYYKTIIPGERNDIQYIDGITPTMAQQEQTVNAARDAKVLQRISPDAEQNQRELLARHTTLRKEEFQNIAGSDVTSNAAMKAANDQIEQQLQAAYAHGGSVDLQPVVDAAKAELTGSAGKLPPVKSAMQQIIDAAQKNDGTGLETDPRQANAVRRVIIFLQSKEGRLANPGYGSPDTMAAMTRVKDILTKQIEPAAPGFTEANANYAKARQALDAREALQEYEPKLYTGPLGNMTFGPMHRLMGDIIKARDPNAPLSGYKALTEEQMNRLKSLHDDLQRVASAQELANAAGSDTTQTLFDMARRAAKQSVSGLVGMGTGFAVGHLFGHEAGMAAGMFTKDALGRMFEQRAVNQATREHNELLHPDPTLYPLKPNPLMQPPTAP